MLRPIQSQSPDRRLEAEKVVHLERPATEINFREGWVWTTANAVKPWAVWTSYPTGVEDALEVDTKAKQPVVHIESAACFLRENRLEGMHSVSQYLVISDLWSDLEELIHGQVKR